MVIAPFTLFEVEFKILLHAIKLCQATFFAKLRNALMPLL